MTFPKEILPDLSVVGRDWTRQRNAVLSHTQTQSLFFFISMSFFMYYNPWVLAKLSSQKCTYGFSCSVNGSLLLQQKAELVMLISCFSREWSSGRSQRGLVSLKHGLKKTKQNPKHWRVTSLGLTWAGDVEIYKQEGGVTPKRSPLWWQTLWYRHQAQLPCVVIQSQNSSWASEITCG